MPRLLARLLRPRKPRDRGDAKARGLGEPASPPQEAGDAELDALRGELVRELDRMAEGHDGSAAFRRC